MAEKSIAPRRPVLLVILDGFGVNPCPINNAVAQARTPRLDEYFSLYPLTILQASGPAVGLPDGQMGNSEVGHLTIGCGQIIRQDLVAIDDAINDGGFFENAVLIEAIEKARHNDRPVHLIGLVSNGGVHSHTRHLTALIEMCQRHGVQPMLHMITDGRDTPPKSALEFLHDIERPLKAANGVIATIGGRYYAMDRDNRWDRTEAAWQAMARNTGPHAGSARHAIEQSYASDLSDEFIPMTVLSGAQPIEHDDAVIFFNFRKDRARQLTSALFKPEFDHFDRGDYQPVTVTCMTEYDDWFRLPIAFRQDRPTTTLAEVVTRAGLKQFHCAETEKYAHVTYFLNGRHGDALHGEERMIVPSPKVSTYDEAPAMSAAAVANEVIMAIGSEAYGLIVVNFANGDMVGHTGKREAVIQAVETLDKEVGRVLDAAIASDYSVVLTADHGNCEQMVDYATGAPHTQHTVFPVPCLIIDELQWRLSIGAGLSSIAPTVLHLMGLQRPDSMTGRSLLLHPANHQS
jgi:2,3-bisphosphoglycerate-independent phosphoglycerate mutase